jgi:hypothetical protein
MAESPIEAISRIDALVELESFLDDKDVEDAIQLVMRLIANPDVSPQKAPPLIVKVQALSARFQIEASTYTYLIKGKAGTDEYKKKGLYHSLSNALDSLAQSLKYLARQS